MDTPLDRPELGEVERLRAENASLRTQLAEVSAASNRLTTMVSHELRTPLQAISIAIELTLRRVQGSADEVPRAWLLEKLARTKKLIGRLDQLIRTFLSASLIRSGHLRPSLEELDLAVQVREVVNRCAEDLEWAGCPCHLETAPSEPGRWDPMHVDLMLTNLLTNAAKYAPGKPIDVRIVGGPERVQLSVRDHGPGIDPASRERLFQQFSRLPSESKVHGFGLGLWIVKHLAEAHGGEVSVQSEPGDEGTTFTVSLPRWT